MKVFQSLLIVCLFALTSCQTPSVATSAADAAPAAAAEMAEKVNPKATTSMLSSNFTRIASAMKDFAEAMPADKYDYKPTPEVDSFAGMLMHAAGAVMSVCGDISNMEAPEVNMEASSKEDIMATMDTIYKHAAKVVASMDDSSLGEEVEIFGGAVKTTKMGAISIASNHVTHHKGGLVVYLRMNGITPPGFQGI